jgi:hypothetical protein
LQGLRFERARPLDLLLTFDSPIKKNEGMIAEQPVNVTHCPEDSVSRFPHICIMTNA